MTEWTVVTVIIVLVGLVATLVKPMLSLNTSMTKLTISNERLSEDLKGLTDKNSEAHARIWQHEDEQDKRLNDHDKQFDSHESRIGALEKGKNK